MEEKKLSIIAIVILLLISIFAVAFFVINENENHTNNTNDANNSGYTQTYTNLSVEEAYDLINQSESGEFNLTIIDCRGLEGCSSCQYKNDGHISGAVRNDNPLTLYNETNSILVYSKDGTVGGEFCTDLINCIWQCLQFGRRMERLESFT